MFILFDQAEHWKWLFTWLQDTLLFFFPLAGCSYSVSFLISQTFGSVLMCFASNYLIALVILSSSSAFSITLAWRTLTLIPAAHTSPPNYIAKVLMRHLQFRLSYPKGAFVLSQMLLSFPTSVSWITIHSGAQVKNLGLIVISLFSSHHTFNVLTASGDSVLRLYVSPAPSRWSPWSVANSSLLDYCNIFQTGFPAFTLDPLQSVFNKAVRGIVLKGKSHHVTLCLKPWI